jgi:hypothetical protein
MKKLQHLLNVWFKRQVTDVSFNVQSDTENSISDKLKKHKMLAWYFGPL